MNKIAIVLSFMTISSTVYAQTSGFDIHNGSGGHVRVGTYCVLDLYGSNVYKGLCNVARRGDNTVINTGEDNYIIARDAFDDHSATFRGVNESYGRVYARGSCWIGRNVRYCAK